MQIWLIKKVNVRINLDFRVLSTKRPKLISHVKAIKQVIAVCIPISLSVKLYFFNQR